MPRARTLYAIAAPLKPLYALLLLFFCQGAATVDTQPCFSYSFKNDDGIEERSNSIPPKFASQGYTCFDKNGSVLKVVPPEPQQDDRKKREREEEAQQAAKEAGLPHQRTDEELQELYASVHDVEEARDRKIKAIDSAISSSRATLEGLKRRKRDLEVQAAASERAGQSPSEILKVIESLDTRIGNSGPEIEAHQIERRHAIEQFKLDLDRMKELQPSAAGAN